jgi:hypothetical protein
MTLSFITYSRLTHPAAKLNNFFDYKQPAQPALLVSELKPGGTQICFTAKAMTAPLDRLKKIIT